MLRTLIILQNYDRDIIRYIVSIIGLDDTDLNTVARALHRLTYCNAGQYSFNGRNNNILDKSVYGKIREQADNFLKCEDDFRPFGSKRLWAALRDYVKSPEFKRLILEGLKRIDSKYGSKWENLCKQPNLIELPGDVWNNNPIFKNKLIGNFVVLRENQRSPEIMRSLYIDLKSDCNEHNLYPEQFDVTFDFIPRMCVKRNCEVCFFGSEGGKILCNPNKGKLCPVSLATCGYLNFCTPDNCEIQGNFETVKKLCKGPSIFKCTAVQNNFF
jgi:hypothetical protein